MIHIKVFLKYKSKDRNVRSLWACFSPTKELSDKLQKSFSEQLSPFSAKVVPEAERDIVDVYVEDKNIVDEKAFENAIYDLKYDTHTGIIRCSGAWVE